MAEPAIRHMTFEEFLRWDGGTDMRYELIDGFPVAMAPPVEAHRILAVRLVSWIDAALAGRRPCNAQIGGPSSSFAAWRRLYFQLWSTYGTRCPSCMRGLPFPL